MGGTITKVASPSPVSPGAQALDYWHSTRPRLLREQLILRVFGNDVHSLTGSRDSTSLFMSNL